MRYPEAFGSVQTLGLAAGDWSVFVRRLPIPFTRVAPTVAPGRLAFAAWMRHDEHRCHAGAWPL